jgi:hypothetical protein
MSVRSGFFPQDARPWLLAIGQRLRVEYSVVEHPVPERLAALLRQLEEPVGTRSPVAAAPAVINRAVVTEPRRAAEGRELPSAH